ncbi:MAG: endonuclease III [Oscillospiraceae bacterium]|nr:endonuclease III [Oscillospiraceae bacterium]
MRKKERALKLIECLEHDYPDALCSLQYEKDYELLFTVRLAAQCTDERVNQIAPALFERFPTLEAFAAGPVEDVERLVHSTGFYRAKARDIVAASQMLLADFGGKVPDNMDDLLKLPGVGRKTANLILGDVYNTPGAIVVDTHCIRITNRMGLVDTKDPVKIEAELRKILPPDKSNDFCHRLVLHGRAVCTARKAKCEICSCAPWCKHFTP